MTKKSLILIIFAFILSLSSLILLGKMLTIERKFGKDALFLPRKIILSGNKVFILDEYADMTSGDEKIKVFTEDGKFLHEFGCGEEGPGCFGSAHSMYISNKTIYILDSERMQIHAYSEEGSNKYLDTKKIYYGAFGSAYSTPITFFVLPDWTMYYNCSLEVKGDKNISKFKLVNKNLLKVEKKFMDCISLFDDQNELEKKLRNEYNNPEVFRKTYWNMAYITPMDKKIYYVTYLSNTVLELSMEGTLLKKYTLPLKSIEKTVKVIKVGQYLTLERKLNYGVIGKNARLYVLSRNEAGDSVIFELVNGIFREKCRMKEEIFSFDISGNQLYGVTREDPEVFVYRLDK